MKLTEMLEFAQPGDVFHAEHDVYGAVYLVVGAGRIHMGGNVEGHNLPTGEFLAINESHLKF